MTSKVRTRERSEPSDAYTTVGGEIVQWNLIPPYTTVLSRTPQNGSTIQVYDYETCIDHTNRRRSGKFIEGSPFNLRRGRYVGKTTPLLSVGNGGNLQYVGTMRSASTAGVYGGVTAPLPDLSDGDASAYYATGWAKARPDRPDASLAQFIGELKDFPRMLQVRARAFKDGGSLYLNYQFGWLPFFRDIVKLYQAQRNIANRLALLRRNNGRPIRRKVTLVKDNTQTVLVNGPLAGNMKPILPSSFYRSSDIVKTTLDHSDKVWFSGRFRYWVPNIDTSDWERSAKRMLFGAVPTPETVWELMPWSWLIDWFSNVGDVISNISAHAIDNMAADYAYVMRENTWRWSTVTTSYLATFPDGAPITASASFERFLETKTRISGSPFGFGLQLRDLSGSQLAILAALGLSRS